jgi:hypothetical protein
MAQLVLPLSSNNKRLIQGIERWSRDSRDFLTQTLNFASKANRLIAAYQF